MNIIDRRLELSGWLERLSDEGVEVHARSVFLQGLLLMPLESLPSQFAQWSNIWSFWHRMIKEKQLDPVGECLAYPISLPGFHGHCWR